MRLLLAIIGILTRASEAKEETQIASEDELRKLTELEAATNLENTEYFDSNGNKAIVPAGFAVSQVEGENTVDDGLVIIDSEGNEFVWIPVGNVNKSDNKTEIITLGRYVFDDNGNIDTELSVFQPSAQLKLNPTTTFYRIEATKDEETQNEHAKDIEGFISSVNKYGGYYIARYEASYGKDGKPNSKISTSYSVNVEPKEEGDLWNFITQKQASTVSQSMYSSDYFTSDLMNSFAYDTAILFIQLCSDTFNYSIMTGNTDILGNTGTSGDEKLNINDLAGNTQEFTTETCSNLSGPCTRRGGIAENHNKEKAWSRGSVPITRSNAYYSFRPILYIN